MGTRLVVIGDALLDDPLQGPRGERNDVIQALASERPDPALGHGIRVRSLHRCPDRLTPKPLRPGHAVAPVGAGAVSDQRAWAMVSGRGLDQLLPSPGRRGMGREVDGLDAAPGMRDEEEDGPRPERERRDGAAVRRPEDAALVGEEGPPLPTAAAWPAAGSGGPSPPARRNRASAPRPGCAPRPSADSPAHGGESGPAPRPGPPPPRPGRCHRPTVSGWRITRDVRQPDQRRRRGAQSRRSTAVTRGRRAHSIR